MRDKLATAILRLLIKLRWAYFHIHPGYYKFTMWNEEYFFHARTNTVHSNYTLKPTKGESK